MLQNDIKKVRFGERELTLKEGSYTLDQIKQAVVDIDPSYAGATTEIMGETLVFVKSSGTKGC